MGGHDDMIELLGVTVTGDTRIETRGGNDIVFIDGVGGQTSDFQRFTAVTGSDKDLVEIQRAIFRGEVDVSLGSGIDFVCGNAAEFQAPGIVSFDGGAPDGGFPGDEHTVEESGGLIINFEGNPDDCSFLGGRE